jgi:tagatose 1,6-diphosphate aldolase
MYERESYSWQTINPEQNEVICMMKIKMSKGKFDGLSAIADKNGIISALAMDQRRSLRKSISEAQGRNASDADLREFKLIVTEVLSTQASAILLDPEFGLDAIKILPKEKGVLLAYEKNGYDTSVKGRLPELLPGWSVEQLITAGAKAIKLLVYYDPDDDLPINRIKQAFVERAGAECLANDIPFFLELVCYSDTIGDEKGIRFARIKPNKVIQYMQEFSRSKYAVDVLKIESPVNMRYVKGAKANTDEQVAYTREQAKEYFRMAATASRLPFIYLSAGVTHETFCETLELAAEAGTPFSGVLCGRATWQDGILAYGREGAKAFRLWLEGQGLQNIQELNRVISSSAKPWWDSYGGRENIEVVSFP